MDTSQARALRAVVQDRLDMGDPVANTMLKRAGYIGAGMFGACVLLTIAAMYVRKRKGECVDCGN